MSKPSWSHPVGRVRLVALADGVSFLVLLGIAMPLKYLADRPEAVRLVGSIHGALVILLLLFLLLALIDRALGWRQAAIVFLASLVPFGPFVIDRRLALREERG